MTTTRCCLALMILAFGMGVAGCADHVSAPDRSTAGTNSITGDAIALRIPSRPTTPDQLLELIATAVEAHDVRGRLLYSAAFCDSTRPGTPAFRGFSDPAVLEELARTTGRQLLDPTDFAVERRFYDYLAGLYPGFTYTFTWSAVSTSPAERVEARVGRTTLRRGYHVEVASSDGTVRKLIAVGYADLELVHAAGRWQVRRWNDRLDPSVGLHPLDTDQVTMGSRRLASLQQ